MMARIIIKIKVPDNANDKEVNEILKKYIDVHPCKTVRFTKIPDGWDWLL